MAPGRGINAPDRIVSCRDLSRSGWRTALTCAVVCGLGAGGSAVRAAAEELRSDRWLFSPVPIERTLAAGQTHIDEFHLEAGRYLEVAVEQLGVDVVLKIYGPGGELLGSFDSPTQNQGTETGLVVAPTSGTYRLEIGTVYQTGEHGGYRIRRHRWRAATARDRHLARYHRIKVEVEHLGRNGGPARDHVQALELHEEMVRHARAASDKVSEAWALTGWAGSHRVLDEPLEALEKARVALGLWREIGHRGMETRTLAFLGDIYGDLGERQKAVDYLERALELGRACENPRWKAYPLQELAILHASQGRPELALTYLRRVVEMRRGVGLLDRQVSDLMSIGRIHASLGRYEKALEVYREALPQSEASRRFETRASLLFEMAWASAELGRRQDAKRMAKLALQAWQRRSEGIYQAHFLYLMPARIDESLGKISDALGKYRAALAIYEDTGDSRFVATTLYEIARLEAREGRLHQALASIERAAGRIDSRRDRVSGDLLRALFLASHNDYYELWIDILMRLCEVDPRGGGCARAFAVVELGRARSLLDRLHEPRRSGRGREDPALRGRKLQLEEWLRSFTLEEIARSENGAGSRRVEASELTDKLSEYREVQDLIQAQKRRKSEPRPARTLTLREVQEELLDRETMLLEYALGEKRSFLWVVTSSSWESFELPGRAEIESSSRRVYELLSARGRRIPFETDDRYTQRIEEADAEYPAAVAELSRMLLAPLGVARGAARTAPRRIVVVADGFLRYIPFSVLSIPGTSRVPGPPNPPLGLELEVVSAPSASVLYALRHRPGALPFPREEEAAPQMTAHKMTAHKNTAHKKTLALIAAPALLGERERLDWLPEFLRRSGAESSGLLELSPLPGSLREAKAIRRLVPEAESLVALGFDASRDLVMDGTLREYRIVHFATHALLNRRHPELSGIVLALVDEKGRPQEGILRLHDVDEMELSADLVVLSACQTALGQEIRGEGLLGLARGFLRAGVPAVVASLWSPDDLATAALMEEFYRGMLRDDLTPSAALRAARVAISREKKWRSPYYWAPFVLQGDARARAR